MTAGSLIRANMRNSYTGALPTSDASVSSRMSLESTRRCPNVESLIITCTAYIDHSHSLSA